MEGVLLRLLLTGDDGSLPGGWGAGGKMAGFQRIGFVSVFGVAGEGLEESRMVTDFLCAARGWVEPFFELGSKAGAVTTPLLPVP